MARLSDYVEKKRGLAKRYASWFQSTDYSFFIEPQGAKSNYWFNSFFAKNREERDIILKATNELGVMTRPTWTPMHTLEIYKGCQQTKMPEAEWVESILINIPSSVPVLK
jgi:dTDP-4-amino-4,6-dideoxygalactose transaminase